MRIAVVGASGRLGRATVDILQRRDHEVRKLSRSSRSHPVDLTTGAGLDKALREIEVVINASNGPSSSKKARAVLVDGTKRLLDATPAHHVCISIVGIDNLPIGAYRVKLAQEAAVRDSGRPFTILRSTQFHSLLAVPLLRVARWHVALRSRARFQPVEVVEVAGAVADIAEHAPRNGMLTIAGPEILTLTQLRAGRGLPVPVLLPPRIGHALRSGALTIAEPDIRGKIRYTHWLALNRERRGRQR